MEVWWGDSLVDTLSFDTTGRYGQDMGWRSYSYPLTASSAATRLHFKSLSANICGPALDAVSVTPFVAPPTYSISGRVTDPNGNPLADVTIDDWAGHTTITSWDGSYTFTGLSEGFYVLAPARMGYSFDPPVRVVSLPGDAPGQDFIASPLPVESISLSAASGYNSVQLTWSVPSDPYVTSYQISRATAGDQMAVFAPIATSRNPFYVDESNLQAGTTYCYSIRALRSNGTLAAASNTACGYVGRLDLWMPDSWGAPGSTVLVPVNVRNANDVRMAAADLWIDFDDTVLTPVGVSASALTSGYLWDYAVNGQRLKIAAVSTNPPTLHGAGALFWVAFQVRGDVGSQSPLNLRTFIGGVGGSSIHNPSYASIPLQLKGGTFRVSAVYTLGDLNGDGVVQAVDALMALDIASGKLSPSWAQQMAGDVNGDGLIGAADATMILYSATHNAWPSLATAEERATDASLQGSTGSARIILDSVKAQPGQTVTLTLRAEELIKVAGGEFVITYDRAMIAGIDSVTASDLAAGFQLSAYDDGAGRLHLAIANARPISGSGTLATLQLHVADSAAWGSLSPLTLASVQLNDLQGSDFASTLGLNVERQSGTLTMQATVYLPIIVR